MYLFAFQNKSAFSLKRNQLLTSCLLFRHLQRRTLHEHGREDPPARRLHHRLHHRVGSGGSSDPQQPVPLPPGEPATGVKIWDSQAGERLFCLWSHELGVFPGFFFVFFLLWCSYCLYFILQITLSYGMFENKSNIINLKGAFPVEEDPSRWETVLCLKGNSTSFYTSKSIYRRKKVAWSLLCLAAHSSSFSKPAAYVTHNATWPISDITGGNLSDYMQLPLEPQKALYYFLHILSSSPQDI